MRASSVKFTRRVLIGVIVLTIASVLFNYLQTWYRRSRQITRTLQVLDSAMKRSAQDIEYFEYGGTPRILRFKIHAKLLLETQAGRNILEGIEACDYNPDGSVRNEIHSRKAEYDPERKIADFSGDVRLFINKRVELRTESLHYDLNSEIGTTPDLMEFHSEQMSGTARGVRFEQKQQSLALNSEVSLTLVQRQGKQNDAAKPQTMHATAQRATCSQITGRILFEGSARLVSDTQTLSGQQIEAALDPNEKRIRSVMAAGQAFYNSKTPEETQSLGGDRIDFGIGKSGALENMSVSGRASFSSMSSTDQQDLRGGSIDMNFDARELPTRIKASTGVSFQMKHGTQQTIFSGDQLDTVFISGTKNPESIQIRKRQQNADSQLPNEQAKMIVTAADSDGSELQADEIRMSLRQVNGRSVLEKLRAEGSARYVSTPAGKSGNSEPVRALNASLLEMFQSGDGNFFEWGSASGNVVISEDSAGSATGPQMKRLSANHAKFHFFDGSTALKDLDADGKVQITYEKKAGTAKDSAVEKFRTASEKMKAVFGLQEGKSVIESVAQWVNFTYDDGLRSASSGRCDYDAATEMLVLTESPKISDETKSTTGNRMEYDQSRKILSVHNRVRSVFSSRKGTGSFFGSSSSSSPAIVTADEMRYWTEGGRVRYTGKVHSLSENQDLRAEILEITDGLDRVDAQGSIRHLISKKESPDTKPANTKGAAADALTTIQSSAMSYLKERNKISYTGKVTLHSREMDLSSDSLDAVPDSEGKNIEQATARGNVVVHSGARLCKGDVADYYMDSKKFVVTGKPAEVYDPDRGRSFARRLTSTTADDTILLEK